MAVYPGSGQHPHRRPGPGGLIDIGQLESKGQIIDNFDIPEIDIARILNTEDKSDRYANGTRVFAVE